MTSSVSIAIVAHPTRSELVDDLAHRVGAESVQWDIGDAGANKIHAQAWDWLADSHGAWRVVIEDDAIPVRHFRDQLHAVLAAAPPQAAIVSLYLGRQCPTHWQSSIARSIAPWDQDPNFLVCQHLLHGVAYAVRAGLLDDMRRYVIKRRARTGPGEHLEEAVSAWCNRRDYWVAYSRPSIVNHNDEIEPVIKVRADGLPRTKGRVAWLFESRKDWKPTCAEIPLPEQIGGELWHGRPRLSLV